MNLIPLIAVKVPADWFVLRILEPFVYTEKDNSNCPRIPVKAKKGKSLTSFSEILIFV